MAPLHLHQLVPSRFLLHLVHEGVVKLALLLQRCVFLLQELVVCLGSKVLLSEARELIAKGNGLEVFRLQVVV
jgi:hypothetical protein